MYSGNPTPTTPPSTSVTHPNGQTNDDDNPPPLPFSRRHCRSRCKALPCPGDVVGWRLAPPTMSPRHRGAFLQHYRQRCARILLPYDAIQLPSRQRHRKCQNMRVVKNHPRVSCSLRPSSTSPADGTNTYNLRPPHAAKNRQKKHEYVAGVAKKRFGASWRCQRRSGAYWCPILTALTPRESH